VPALDGADRARGVRTSIAHFVDVVEQRRGSRCAKEEIGLKTASLFSFFTPDGCKQDNVHAATVNWVRRRVYISLDYYR
jgi:hypothetical protein